jgi:hypothetical protein
MNDTKTSGLMGLVSLLTAMAMSTETTAIPTGGGAAPDAQKCETVRLTDRSTGPDLDRA